MSVALTNAAIVGSQLSFSSIAPFLDQAICGTPTEIPTAGNTSVLTYRLGNLSGMQRLFRTRALELGLPFRWGLSLH